MASTGLLFGGLLGFLIGLITLIIFFVMANRIGSIRWEVKDLQSNLRSLLTSTTYRCKHCGYRSNNLYDFCPVCDMNSDGRTLSELRKRCKESPTLKDDYKEKKIRGG